MTIYDIKVTIDEIKVIIYEIKVPIYKCERLEGPVNEVIFYISFHLQEFLVVSSNYKHHIHSQRVKNNNRLKALLKCVQKGKKNWEWQPGNLSRPR